MNDAMSKAHLDRWIADYRRWLAMPRHPAYSRESLTEWLAAAEAERAALG